MPVVAYPIINGIIDLTYGITDPDPLTHGNPYDFYWVFENPPVIDLTEDDFEVEGW